jgi:hypothetical protein
MRKDTRIGSSKKTQNLDSDLLRFQQEYLLVGGLEHQFYFSHHIGNFIIPIDFSSIIFSEGW